MCLEDKNSQNFPILLWTLAPTQKPKLKKKKLSSIIKLLFGKKDNL